MWPSVVAVAGTLLGGVVAAWAHARFAESARREGRDEQRREAMLAAVVELVAALGDHRRAMWRREQLRLSGGAGEAREAARSESRATRSAVTAPLTMVCMLAPQVAGEARQAAEAALRLRDAGDMEALAALRRGAIEATDRLVAAVSAEVNGRG